MKSVSAVLTVCGLSALITTAVVLPAAASGAPPAVVHPATGGVGAHVIVLGVRGARWETFDGSTAPGTAGLSLASSLGAMSMRSAAAHTCPADAWLTIGTGTRAAHPQGCSAVVTVSAGGDVAGFAGLAGSNKAGPYAAVAGAFADTLGAAGICTTAIGPLAALAAAHADGRVDNYRADPTGLTAQDLLACGVTFIDVPALPEGDAVVKRVLDTAVGDDTLGTAARILLIGTGDGTDRLAAAAFLGAPFAPGLMTSPEVGRAPYLQLVDVPATILSVFHGAVSQPTSFIGSGAGVVDVTKAFPQRLQAVRSAAIATETRATTFPLFVGLLLGVQLVAWLGLWALWRRTTVLPRRRAVALAAGGLGLGGEAAPAASFLASLAPWQTSSLPLLLVVGATLFASAALAAAAARARRRGPVAPIGAICAVGALVLAFDVVYASRLQFNAVLGYDAITAGRFRGFGNLASGIFTAVSLLAIGVVSGRQATSRGRLLAALGGGALAVTVIGAPMWGADVGGVLALLPAVVVLALLVSGRRVSPAKALLGALAAVVVVGLLGLLDAARVPEKRTHLGRFVASLSDGTGGVTISRRFAADAHLLANPLSLLLLAVCAVAAWIVFRRPPAGLRALFAAHPELHAAVLATAVAAAIGLIVNDSGIAVLAGAALVVAPAVGAAAAYESLGAIEERRGIAALSDAVLP
ncbi:MAG: hypothetical protein QOG52_2769 [Frankiaceae bacterium]|nr:hypothetical protein [Frankiaceae bacterium]